MAFTKLIKKIFKDSAQNHGNKPWLAAELIVALRKSNHVALETLTITQCSAEQLEAIFNIIIENNDADKLRVLTISENRIEALPDTIGQFTQLEQLYATGNRLSELPESILECDQLTTLLLTNNQLNALPEQISRLGRLTTLNLAINQISALPNDFHLLPLNELNLNKNPQLTQLPEQLGEMTSLVVFSCQGCGIRHIPDSFSRLVNLSSTEVPMELVTMNLGFLRKDAFPYEKQLQVKCARDQAVLHQAVRFFVTFDSLNKQLPILPLIFLIFEASLNQHETRAFEHAKRFFDRHHAQAASEQRTRFPDKAALIDAVYPGLINHSIF